jgi:hypothetical protein
MESAKIPAITLDLNRVERWSQRLLASLALIALVVFAATALIRLGYPYEIEWIEGATVDGLRWILSGRLLYSPPELAYLPPPYTPLYYYLSAPLMAVLGEGFVAPRLVALLATLACFALVYLIVAEHTRAERQAASVPGLVAAGLYAASYMFSGQWFDLARPDSLALALLLAGVWVQLRATSGRALALAGALYALAYFSKQNVLVPIGFVMLGSLVRQRLKIWPLVVSLGLVGGGLVLLMNVASDGWYWFYTIDMLSHNVRTGGPETFWQLFTPVAWPGLLGLLAYFVMPLLDKQVTHPVVRHHFVMLCFALGLVLSSWLVWMQRWTADNGHMPAMLAVSLLVGLLWVYVRALSQTLRMIGLSALVLIQFGLLVYNPMSAIPSEADRQAGDEFIGLMRRLSGKGWLVDHGYLARLAGRDTYFHASAFADFSGLGAADPRSDDNAWRRLAVQAVLTDTLTTQHFDWIIADMAPHGWPPYYLVEREIFDEPGVFTTLAGEARRPNYLLMRNPIVHGGPVPLNDPRFARYLSGAWGTAQARDQRALQGDGAIDLMLDGAARYDINIVIHAPCDDGPAMASLTWRGSPVVTGRPLSCGGDRIVLVIPPETTEAALGRLEISVSDALPAAVSVDLTRPTP